MSPAPAVTLTESGAAFTASAETIGVTDANSHLTTTPATANTSTTNGEASFGSLIFTSSTTSDTLTATLPLNSSLTISTKSTTFSVGQVGTSVTISCAACSPNPPYGTALTFTAVVSPPNTSNGTVDRQHFVQRRQRRGDFRYCGCLSRRIARGQPLRRLLHSTLSVTTHTVEAIFTATGSFESGNNSTMVTVTAAPTTVQSLLTASPVNSGQTLGSSTLSGGTVVSTSPAASGQRHLGVYKSAYHRAHRHRIAAGRLYTFVS